MNTELVNPKTEVVDRLLLSMDNLNIRLREERDASVIRACVEGLEDISQSIKCLLKGE